MFWFIQIKMTLQKGIKQKYIFYQKVFFKNYNVIINRKNFHDQPFDSDIKRYEKIRKLTADQGEGYTT